MKTGEISFKKIEWSTNVQLCAEKKTEEDQAHLVRADRGWKICRVHVLERKQGKRLAIEFQSPS